MCVLLTSITFPVIWSSVLISVTREWRYCGLVYEFFLINNIELKCSFVRWRKYHKSWSNGAAELHIWVDLLCDSTAAELRNSVNLLHISVDLLCGTMAVELHNSVDLLCDTTAAELHNSVNLLCGTAAAELNPVGCIGVANIFQRQGQIMLKNMKAWSKVKFNSSLLKDEGFGRFSISEIDVRFTKIQQTF